jgi:hypothetical protein
MSRFFSSAAAAVIKTAIQPIDTRAVIRVRISHKYHSSLSSDRKKSKRSNANAASIRHLLTLSIGNTRTSVSP